MHGTSNDLIAGSGRSQRRPGSGVGCPSSPIDTRVGGFSLLSRSVPHSTSQSHRLHFLFACPRKHHLPPQPPSLYGVGILTPLSHCSTYNSDWLEVRTMIGWPGTAAATEILHLSSAGV